MCLVDQSLHAYLKGSLTSSLLSYRNSTLATALEDEDDVEILLNLQQQGHQLHRDHLVHRIVHEGHLDLARLLFLITRQLLHEDSLRRHVLIGEHQTLDLALGYPRALLGLVGLEEAGEAGDGLRAVAGGDLLGVGWAQAVAEDAALLVYVGTQHT